MKIKSLYITKFKGLNDFKIEFNDGVTVLIGENGTGKTTILETIYFILTYDASTARNKIMLNQQNIIEDDIFISQDSTFQGAQLNLLTKIQKDGLELEFEKLKNGDCIETEKVLILKVLGFDGKSTTYDGDWEYLRDISLQAVINSNKEKAPHIVYLPTEANFQKYKVESVKKYQNRIQFALKLNNELISKGLKDFLVYQHYRDLEDKENGQKGNRIKKYKDLYNSFLEDKEFIGIKDLEPLFEVKATGEIHSVDELSSGEKQIFFRAGSILEYNLQNSIILIDEPEISMHPEWQQKILDFYRKVAGNNQLIIATHSPHIVSSCKREEIRVLVRDKDKIIVNEHIDGTYGRTVEQLLLSVFELKAVRDTKIQEKLDEFKRLYIHQDRISDQKKARLEKLKNELYKYLDPNDPELSLVDVDIATEKLKSLMDELKVN